jgi:hypothetical protein
MLLALPASGMTRDTGLVTITSHPPSKTTSKSATFTFKVNASYPAKFVCELDGDASGCTSPVTYIGQLVGKHTFTVRAYAGEISLGAASWTWIIDSTIADFTLELDKAELPLTTRVGYTSVKPVHVQILRLGGSKGPVSITPGTASGGAWILQVAPGVEAKIVPNDPANPTILTVWLTAKPWVPAVVGKLFFFQVLPSSPAVAPQGDSIGIQYSVLDEYDLAVRGIDVTQGIQPDKPLPAGRTAAYDGVKLVKDKRTKVRVFASVVFPTSWSVHNARIYLRGWRFKNGSTQQSLGQPLISGLATLNGGLDAPVSLEVREKNPPSWTFTLPPSWTEAGPIALEAEVKPPTLYQPAATSECSTADCAVNNSYKLVDIPFVDTGYVQVWPVYLKLKGGFTSCCPKNQTWFMPDNALWAAGQLLPLADGELRTNDFDFRAEFWVNDAVKSAMTWSTFFGCTAKCRLDPYLIGYSEDLRYAQVCPGAPSCPDVVMSMLDDTPFPRLMPGPIPNPWVVAGLNRGIASVGPLYSVANDIVNPRRPLTSVAHELGHALGLKHASWGCGGADGEKADLGWPDPFGYIHGVGLDMRPPDQTISVYDGTGTGGAKTSTAAPYPFVGSATNVSSKPGSWYDFMSYCAGFPQVQNEYWLHGPTNPSELQQGAISPWQRSDAWISTRNWKQVQAFLTVLKVWHAFFNGTAAMRAAAPDEATLAVRGFVQAGHAAVTYIAPRPGQPSADTKSDYELVLRKASGSELLRWPLAAARADDGAGVTLLSSDVPLGGVEPGALPADLAAVEVVSGSNTFARVARSASPPVVRLLTPTGPGPVGSDPTATVTWTATDADPGAELRVSIDYSTDDGRTWDTLYGGPNTGRADIRSARLSASKRARLRVRVSDGFDEVAATSDRFEAVGRPPAIRVLSPRRGERARADEALYLSASAYDDTGAFLDDSAFTWYDGREQIAQGRMGSATIDTPGRHILRVVARDGSGREGTAVVPVQILRTAPDIFVSGVPAAVAPRVRHIGMKVACTLPAALSITGPAAEALHTRCDPTPRTVTVRVRATRGPLRLVLEAVAQGRVSRLTLVFGRRT